MGLEPVVAAVLGLGVVLLVLAPLLAWVDEPVASADPQPDDESAPPTAAGRARRAFDRLVRLPVVLLQRLATPDATDRFAPESHAGTPALTALTALLLFAVIPFAGVYETETHTLGLVIARPDPGLLFVFAVAAVAALGSLGAVASRGSEASADAMRTAAQRVSFLIPLALALVSLSMTFATLDLQSIAIAQDQTVRVLALLAPWAPHALVEWVRVPGWGIVVQPVAFVLALVALAAVHRRPPFDAPEHARSLASGCFVEYSGARTGIALLAELVPVVAVAALLATLFLGGWALPWLSTEAITEGLRPALGVTGAALACALVHLMVFGLKVAAMIWLQLAVRWSLPRLDFVRAMALCWKLLVPVGLANILVTGAIVLRTGLA